MKPRPGSERRQTFLVFQILWGAIFLHGISAHPVPLQRYPIQEHLPPILAPQQVNPHPHNVSPLPRQPAPCDGTSLVQPLRKEKTPHPVFFPYTVPIPWPTPFNGTDFAPIPEATDAMIPTIPVSPNDDTYPLYIPVPRFAYVPVYYNAPRTVEPHQPKEVPTPKNLQPIPGEITPQEVQTIPPENPTIPINSAPCPPPLKSIPDVQTPCPEVQIPCPISPAPANKPHHELKPPQEPFEPCHSGSLQPHPQPVGNPVPGHPVRNPHPTLNPFTQPVHVWVPPHDTFVDHHSSYPSIQQALHPQIQHVPHPQILPTPHPQSHPTPPYPQGHPTPYPQGHPTPYPQGHPTPYPPGHPTPYPQGHPTPYPQGHPTPYPQGHPTPYPQGHPTSYPQGHPTPYPQSHPTSHPQDHPIPHHQISHPTPYPQNHPTPYPQSHSSPYPLIHPTPYPIHHHTPPSHYGYGPEPVDPHRVIYHEVPRNIYPDYYLPHPHPHAHVPYHHTSIDRPYFLKPERIPDPYYGHTFNFSIPATNGTSKVPPTPMRDSNNSKVPQTNPSKPSIPKPPTKGPSSPEQSPTETHEPVGGRSSHGIPPQDKKEDDQAYVLYDPEFLTIVEGKDGDDEIIYAPETITIYDENPFPDQGNPAAPPSPPVMDVTPQQVEV